MTIRPTRPSAAVLSAVALLVGLAVPGVAQESPPRTGSLTAGVDLYLGVTELARVAAGQAGLAAGLDIGHGVRIGGGAWSILRRIDEGPVLEGSGLELGLGYGGPFVEYSPTALPLAARLLVGGGAATLRTAAVGTRYDTETFVVVEPALVGHIALPGPFGLGAAAGFRWVHGADALFLAGNEDLHGVHASLFIRIGR